MDTEHAHGFGPDYEVQLNSVYIHEAQATAA
jgi:hypothetical protein